MGEQDASPYTSTAGCFDRRYWAWKLVDFPEATFQRLVFPLALLYRDPLSRLHGRPEALAAVRAGLSYAARIQHGNGAFDQAFPFEQSYGATAFLLYPLLEAARLVDEHLSADERTRIEWMGRRAAAFLCDHDERHGTIANHLAGAAAALLAAADRFREPRFERRAVALVDRVLDGQSAEGWFSEYGGADPGYQTLCVDYLSEVSERRPSPRLDEALERALGFLQWFVHPDGTFGGIYGSRRTSLVYLGGLARLSSRSAVAAALCEATGAAMARADTAGPSTMDAGNLAPVLTSVARALPHVSPGMGARATLPCEAPAARVDFPEAGIHVRGTARYYAVFGATNGGTLTIFSRDPRRLVVDDGGYVAVLANGTPATTQVTDGARRARVGESTIEVDAPFAQMPTAVPTPGRFLLLRALNLSAMRSIPIGNWVKRKIVGMLMAGGRAVPLRLVRRVTFDATSVRVEDRLENPDGVALRSMTGGQPFSGIHMASAGYFHAVRLGTASPPQIVDVQRLGRERAIDVLRVVQL